MDYLMGGGGSRKNTPRFRAIVPDPDEDLEGCCCRGVPGGGGVTAVAQTQVCPCQPPPLPSFSSLNFCKPF